MAPIRPMLNEAGVTEQQWRVLRVLDGAGPMDLKTLADSALLFGPSLSRIIKDLADRGLVLRKNNPKVASKGKLKDILTSAVGGLIGGARIEVECDDDLELAAGPLLR